MATLTIRDLDDALKQSLRVRAARRNHSMEEEVRQILRAALRDHVAAEVGIVERVRARFADLGGVDLPLEPREPMRDVSALGGSPIAKAPRRPRTAMSGARK